MKLKLFIILIALLFSTVGAFAEFYKYIDKEGNILFTDNLSEVPQNQRPGVIEYGEPEKKIESSKESGYAEESAEVQPEEDGPLDNTSNDPAANFNNRKNALEQEYILLKKENAELANTKKNLETKAQVESYNKKVLLMNEKIENYKKNKAELNSGIEEYNKSIQMDREDKKNNDAKADD
ncbi:MAG: hypothetical protein J7K30_02900 [Deltaproteobacteria bacterium]|nr:hypothetical protein [Deltaproteobacteria bacterium]